VTGSAAIGPVPARRPCREPRQLDAEPGLVDKDEVLGGDAVDPFGKACPSQGTGGGALGGDIGAPRLARPKGLVLRGKPSRLRVTQSTGRLDGLLRKVTLTRPPYGTSMPGSRGRPPDHSAEQHGADQSGDAGFVGKMSMKYCRQTACLSHSARPQTTT
jgi:hypothetical protein